MGAFISWVRGELERLEELILIALHKSGGIPSSIAGTGFWKSISGVLQPTASIGQPGQVPKTNSVISDIAWAAEMGAWVTVSGTFTPANDQTVLLVDTSGPQATINMPSAPYDGQNLIVYDYEGLAATNPIRFALGSPGTDPTTTIDDPSNPGTAPGASGHIAQQGQTAWFKYFASAKQWQLVTTSTPYVAAPNSWAQATWFIDPANSSGVASDSNKGTTSGAPLLTYAELLRRWSSRAIDPSVPVTVTFMSAQAAINDPVGITLLGSQTITFQGQFGAAQQFFSGTIAGLVAKNTATGQKLQMTQWAGAAIGQVVVNSTHPSVAVVHAVTGGNAIMGQPLTATAPPSVFGSPVDTWANGDNITVYTPSAIRLSSFENRASGIYIYRLGQLAPSFEGTFLSQGAFVSECVGPSGVSISGVEYIAAIINNCRFKSIDCDWPTFGGGGNITSNLIILAGSCGDLQTTSADIRFGLCLSASTHVHTTAGKIEEVEVDSGAILEILGITFTPNGGLLWGLGRLDIAGSGDYVYGGAAVATFLLPTITINNASTAYALSVAGGTLSWLGDGTTGRSVTAANLDAAVGAGGFATGLGAFAVNPGGGSLRSPSL